MFEPKAILRFALILVVSFTVLMWPWERWERDFAAWFRGFGNASLSQFWFWPAGSVQFVNLKSPDVFDQVARLLAVELPPEYRDSERFRPQGERDTLLVLQNRNTPQSFGLLRTSSRGIGYWSTAAVVALALAAPLAWRKKGWVLLWGLAGVHLFILLRLSLFVAANGFFDPEKKYALHASGPLLFRVLKAAEGTLCDNPTVSFVGPVFIWLAVLLGLRSWWIWRDRVVSRAAERPPRRLRREDL